MTHSKEAFWWSLFSAGGVLAALFLPAFIVVTGFLLPFFSAQDVVVYGKIHDALSMWWVRCVILVVVFLSLFHCFHRIRHILMDLGLRRASTILSVFCYGSALVGTLLMAMFLIAM